jgi:hypothetical protein
MSKNYKSYLFLGGILLLAFLTGCEPLPLSRNNLLPLDSVLQLRPGKYITYRTDSMVFPQFGRQVAIRSYLEKQIIDSSYRDNLGQTTYRVLRFINDTLARGAWQPAGSFSITRSTERFEWNEDNRRYIKLQQPLQPGNTWKGNRYLPDQPFEPLYPFSNDDNMPNWNYQCIETTGSFSFRNNTYERVITIEQADEQFNVPIVQTNAYAFRNRAVDKFSTGIGLVYRELECWEYQPNTGGSGGPYRVGFGIKQWMVDHN